MRAKTIQQLVEDITEAGRKDRARTQITLGKLIEVLEAIHLREDGDMKVVVVGAEEEYGEQCTLVEPHSYRGYYSDLAFQPQSNAVVTAAGAFQHLTVEAVLILARGSLGHTFTGYKGGDFKMQLDTPLWVARYGCTGHRIMSLTYNHEDYRLVVQVEKES